MAPLTIDPSGPPNGIALGPGAGLDVGNFLRDWFVSPLSRTLDAPTDQIKNYAKKLVENRPDPSALRKLVRSRKPQAIRFRDDGIVPTIRAFRFFCTAA